MLSLRLRWLRSRRMRVSDVLAPWQQRVYDQAAAALDAGRLPGAPVAAAGTREEGWFVATRAGDGATRLWHNRFHTASGGR